MFSKDVNLKHFSAFVTLLLGLGALQAKMNAHPGIYAQDFLMVLVVVLIFAFAHAHKAP